MRAMHEELTGTFVVVVGSSGSGKGTLIRHLKTSFPNVVFPSSHVTRPMRENESEGFPYHFLSVEEFEKNIAEDKFLEWAQFSGNYYGTLSESILPHLTKGEVVIKELEVQGVRLLLEKLPRHVLKIVFIDAGNWEEYAEARIHARAPISEGELAARRKRYEDEQTFKTEADFVVQNKDGDLEIAKKQFEEIIRSIIT